MVELVMVIIVSIICQYTVEQIKKLFRYHKGRYFKNIINLKILTSIVCSLLMTCAYNIDMLALLGLTTDVPLIGQIITAIIVSAGSTTVHELVGKINEERKKDDE